MIVFLLQATRSNPASPAGSPAAASGTQWTEVAEAWATMASAVVACLGFVILIYQIYQLRQAIRADTHGKVYDHALEVQRFFVECPEFRAYFYDGKRMHPEDGEYPRLLAFTELFADYLEHIMLQCDHVPNDVRVAWENYTRSFLRSSPVLCAFIARNEASYCKGFVKIFRSERCFDRDGAPIAGKGQAA